MENGTCYFYAFYELYIDIYFYYYETHMTFLQVLVFSRLFVLLLKYYFVFQDKLFVYVFLIYTKQTNY